MCIRDRHIPFHLIGQLQANKIGKVLPVVDTIESVDSIELAEKIARRATMRGITVGDLFRQFDGIHGFDGDVYKRQMLGRASGTSRYRTCGA